MAARLLGREGGRIRLPEFGMLMLELALDALAGQLAWQARLAYGIAPIGPPVVPVINLCGKSSSMWVDF